MIIYKTTNIINKKIYVGLDTRNNPNYLGSGKNFLKAIEEYRRENFKKEILEECNSSLELNEREMYWIKKMDARNPSIGYNISRGGKFMREVVEKTYIMPKSTREKMSKAKKGRKNPNFKKFGRENKSAKQVLQFDLNENLIASYHSITKAGETTGINIPSIGMCCKEQRKSAGGFIWKYGFIKNNTPN